MTMGGGGPRHAVCAWREEDHDIQSNSKQFETGLSEQTASCYRRLSVGMIRFTMN